MVRIFLSWRQLARISRGVEGLLARKRASVSPRQVGGEETKGGRKCMLEVELGSRVMRLLSCVGHDCEWATFGVGARGMVAALGLELVMVGT